MMKGAAQQWCCGKKTMKDMTLTQLVKRYPRTVEIMDRYGMDRNIGGLDTLEEAAMILGLSVDTIDREFEAVAV